MNDPDESTAAPTISAHIVVRDAADGGWYAEVFGAREENRLAVPDGGSYGQLSASATRP